VTRARDDASPTMPRWRDAVGYNVPKTAGVEKTDADSEFARFWSWSPV